jgi:hypothetical protein
MEALQHTVLGLDATSHCVQHRVSTQEGPAMVDSGEHPCSHLSINCTPCKRCVEETSAEEAVVP